VSGSGGVAASVRVGAGLSEGRDSRAAFTEAAEAAALELAGAECTLAIVFAGSPHLGHGAAILDAVHDVLRPGALVGCGAGGVVAAGREVEDGACAAVWALSAPGASVRTHALETRALPEGLALSGLPQDPAELGEALILLADPHTFAAEALLAHLNDARPGMPVLGGLASAAAVGSASLLRDREVLDGGAVACSLSGVEVVPCVSQGAMPVGPEMTVTAAEGNVIEELASQPALERLRSALGDLDEDERELAGQGLLLGVVIDENQPDYRRGDFLVRPIVGVDAEAGSIAFGDRVRVGQTVRLHVRDGESADADLREALSMCGEALGAEGAAGALLFTCNGRGRHMFGAPDHDAGALDDAFGAPVAGFFCAGEIGPVGGRSFLHGFTATVALFPRS
jgi:small ligand-binding sensory domain FIST